MLNAGRHTNTACWVIIKISQEIKNNRPNSVVYKTSFCVICLTVLFSGARQIMRLMLWKLCLILPVLAQVVIVI